MPLGNGEEERGASLHSGWSAAPNTTLSARLRRKFAEMWKWGGPVRLAISAMKHVTAPIGTWSFSYIFEGEVPHGMAQAKESNEFRVQIYSGLDFAPLLQGKIGGAGDSTPRAIEQRLGAGDWVGVAHAGEEVAAFSWATTNPESARRLESTLLLQPSEMYQYDAYTFPRWRGKGAIREIGARMQREGFARGCLRTLSYVDVENYPSVRASLRMGKRRVGLVLTLRFFKMKRSRSWLLLTRRRRADKPAYRKDPLLPNDSC